MKYIKTHKKQVLIIAVVLLVLVILFALIHSVMPDKSKSTWGNRLNDIDKHPISSNEISNIKNALTDTGKVEEVVYHLTGKTMNFIITVKNDTKRDAAKALAEKIIDAMSDDVKSYYDVQLYYKTQESNDDYPFMAYKNKISNNFSFTYEG